MFSLVLVVLAIALSIGLGLMSMHHAGTVFTQAGAKAEAARLKAEEQQILLAMDAYRADHGSWPVDLQALVDSGHLRSVPVGAQVVAARREFSLISSAHAQVPAPGWFLLMPGQPAIGTPIGLDREVCRRYNQASRGVDGVLKQPYGQLSAQCYGTDGRYQVLAFKAGATFSLPVQTGNVPSDPADQGWDVQPGAADSATPPSQPPEPTDPTEPIEPTDPVDPVEPTEPVEPADPEPQEPEGPTSGVHVVQNSAAVLEGNWGQSPPTGQVRYRNYGDAPATLTFSGITAPLSVSPSICSMAPGAECAVDVTLASVSNFFGTTQQTLIANDDSGRELRTNITGTIYAVIMRPVANTAVNLKTTPNGDPVSGVITWENQGNAPAAITFALRGGAASPFTLDRTACTLAPGAQCEVRVTMASAAQEAAYSDTVRATGGVETASTSVSGAVEMPGLQPRHFHVYNRGVNGAREMAILNQSGQELTLTSVSYSGGFGLSAHLSFGSTTYGGISNDEWRKGPFVATVPWMLYGTGSLWVSQMSGPGYVHLTFSTGETVTVTIPPV